jgi:hypothetical protein
MAISFDCGPTQRFAGYERVRRALAVHRYFRGGLCCFEAIPVPPEREPRIIRSDGKGPAPHRRVLPEIGPSTDDLATTKNPARWDNRGGFLGARIVGGNPFESADGVQADEPGF